MPLLATALKPCPTIEGHDVTDCKLALAGNTVNDHVIGGNAHRCGIAVVIEEVRARTATTDRICAHLVQFSSCYAGTSCLSQASVNFCNNQPGFSHPLDLIKSLVFNVGHCASFG